jgi:two-component SAPR family response regulator
MKSRFNLIKLIPLSFFLIFLCTAKSKGQSYGLGFHSHDVVADQRTALDLFPDKGLEISKNFRLSFELSFQPDQADYFGYIFRIIENETRNIDLIYNKRKFIPDSPTEDHDHFKLVTGDRFSKIGFHISLKQLLEQWNKIILEFDFDHDRLIVYANGNKYAEINAHLNKNGHYRLLFGVNDYPDFKTSDAAPINLRNVRIEAEGKTRFFWPLNEADGQKAHELIEDKDGLVKHPLWIRALHQNWKLMKTMHVNGIASAAFNPAAGEIYIIGSDSLWRISAKNGNQTATAYSSGKFNLLHSNESAYNVYNHTLYNYYLDRKNKTVAAYNFDTRSWNRSSNYPAIIDYWHSNNFFSAADSSLYIVGGYGQLTYKSSVHRYHIPSQRWQEVAVKGDKFSPRYLAASGTTDSGRYAYFLGGYGSSSGQQMLNPKNLFDLTRFDVKTKSFKKIYDLNVSGKGFTFANTMVIDEQSRKFYALAFENHTYNSQLQLLSGSLRNPSYQMIGGKIPFDFYDTHSFANLFYSPQSAQLIAVTLFRSDDNNSTIHIYTLSSPPESRTLVSMENIPASHGLYYLIPSGLLLGAGGIIMLIYFQRKRKSRGKTFAISRSPLKPAAADPALIAELLHDDQPDSYDHKESTILLFGDLKLYTPTGDDITGHFTALVKELFIVIIVHSLKSGRGISPEKLIELMWNDKTDTSARNNRSANLSRLKSLLGQMEFVHLSKATGSYTIEIDFDKVYVDYYQYLRLISNLKTITAEKIVSLIEITDKGPFLPSTDYPWLDQTKSDISNKVIDTFLQYAGQIALEDDPEILIRLSNCIFNFDPVNEEAIVIKCKALYYLGKRTLAKSAFQAFNKEYLAFYGEEFKRDLQSILGQP